MKTATLALNSNAVSGWYAKTPHAFQTRDEMGKRMTIGLLIALALYLLAMGAYFISAQERDVAIAPKPKTLALEAQTIEPPQPPDARQDFKNAEAVSAKEIAAGILVAVSADKALSNAEARNAAQMAVSLAIASGLADALNEIANGFGDGLPTPTKGSTNAGLLANLDGKMGGLTGLDGGFFRESGLGTQAGTLFAQGSPNGNALGAATRSGVGGDANRATGLGRGGVRVAARKQQLITKDNLRSADDIAKTLDKYQSALQDLFAAFSAQLGNAQATVQFVIAPDGSVLNAQVVKKNFNNPTFERDLQRRFRQMRFSMIPVQANQSVTAPFNFSEEL